VATCHGPLLECSYNNTHEKSEQDRAEKGANRKEITPEKDDNSQQEMELKA